MHYKFVLTAIIMTGLWLSSGCSTTPVMQADFPEQKRSVGIVALVDQHTTRQYVGANKFKKKTDWVSLSQLNLQKTIQDVASQYLNNAGIQTKTIDASGFPAVSNGSYQDYLKNLAKAHDVDFLVFITPASKHDVVFGKNQVIRGHGIYYQTFPNAKHNTVVYYSGRVLSYDVRENTWGGQSASGVQTTALSHAYLYQHPTEKTADLIKRYSPADQYIAHHQFEDFSSLSPQQLDQIQTALDQLTEQAVTQMMAQLPFNKTIMVQSQARY